MPALRLRGMQLWWWLAAALALPGCTAEGVIGTLSGGRDGLWRNVQQRCLASAPASHPDCAQVDRSRGLVLYKDAIGVSHYLVIPAHPVTGVEDGKAWDGAGANPWAFGWEARGIVGQALGKAVPDDMLGLAINSRSSRSQDQLHIHLDCISAAARALVNGGSGAIGTGWTALRHDGKPVRAKFVPASTPVLTVDPFLLVRNGANDGAAAPPPDRGIFVTYVRDRQGRTGFVVVDQPVDKTAGSNGHASDFLDRRCRLAQELAAAA
ncbi:MULTISPECIES: CDP-diacylglycerol diphosphatase [Cupriavidus]|uniref:CDP-diacylglycerol diphosphatase n=1 Tax=Cupriavidus sp. DF5525 TaxID=3160989 RepID=UPI0003B01A95|nr:CDP-diacylglycerol pyrophosphatase [Ralstonia pickettii DTP0602]